jgi:fructuronate reductase
VSAARPALTRALLASRGQPVPLPPVRIVHLGLGAFHRAHQAWYTAHAGNAREWGIVAFTGRSAAMAEVLSRQDGLYTVIERSPAADRHEIVASLAEAHDGANISRLVEVLANPDVALVTITVTEAGYRLRADGSPDRSDAALVHDLATLHDTASAQAHLGRLSLTTMLGRLLAGLEARRRASGPGIAVVPCDNLPANGTLMSRGTIQAAELVSPGLAEWITQSVSFVSTSVDRITPRTTAADAQRLNAQQEWADAAPVVTEPFRDWVLSGSFPAGRPAWEDAGARFVDDIEPWERRKLWLLNGAHTLLSFGGRLRGHETIAQAIGDPVLSAKVEEFWDEASAQLPAGLSVVSYRAALLERFRNSRIEHRLAQIAEDGTRKLSLRIVPVAEAQLRAGRLPGAAAFAIACWIACGPDRPESLSAAIASVSPYLAAREVFVSAVGDYLSAVIQ